jgi:hypothetical protein
MPKANPHLDHESTDVNVRGVVLATSVLIVVTLVAIGLTGALFGYLNREAQRAQGRSPMATTEVQLPSAPLIQHHPEEELRQMQEEQARILNGYRWVDKDAGVARIPIDRAMKVVLERGLLTPKPPAEPAAKEQPGD